MSDFKQSTSAFDDSPQRFKERNPEDQFSGASGVLFEQAMAQTRMAICLTDPNTEDQPIVFANRAFRELTGYSEDEIVGYNCRFLQGEGTDPEKVAQIRQAIEKEEVIVVELLNYRKDGTPFWNALHLGPIYDENNELIYYFGSQWDVTDVHTARSDEAHAKAMARELSHRMKNMFSVISAIINVTGRTHGIEREMGEINARIQALGRAYDSTLDEASLGSIEVGQAIKSVLNHYRQAKGELRFLGNGVRTDPNIVSTLGLTMHELASNAIKHGALRDEGGRVDVNWTIEEDEAEGRALVIRWEEYTEHEVRSPDPSGGAGLGIIDNLLRGAGGTLHRDWKKDGLKASITVPLHPGDEITHSEGGKGGRRKGKRRGEGPRGGNDDAER